MKWFYCVERSGVSLERRHPNHAALCRDTGYEILLRRITESVNSRVMNRILIVGFALFTALVAGAAHSRPLWDGKTLQGWHIIGKGEWKIEDGAIHGTHSKSEGEFGHLVTDRAFTNFTLRVKYKTIKGNSGVYFRSKEKGFSGISGFQAEIDPLQDAGGLYETNGRSWVSHPKPEQVKTWFQPGEWNEMTVTAGGRDIVVRVNGKKSAEVKNDTGRLSGKFALQVHGGQDCDVWFKDIEITED
jgi:hypothetical protein